MPTFPEVSRRAHPATSQIPSRRAIPDAHASVGPPSASAIAWEFMLNPVVPPIEFFRQAFLGVTLVPNSYFLLSAVISFVVLVIGVILFNRAEQTAMDTI